MKNTHITEAINAIAHRNKGRITPEEVVEAATDESSPLHDFFEWDDGIAGHRFRLEQARTLIRSVTVTIKTETVSVSTVAYVRDPSVDSRDQGYVSVSRIRKHEDACRDVLLSEFGRVNAHLNRARSLAQVFGLADEVDSISETVSALSVRAIDAQPIEALAA